MTEAELIEIDFEKKQIIGRKEFYMDHQKLLERAIEVCLMFDKKDYSN